MTAKTIDLLQKIYDKDSETGAYIIRLSIKEYTDIFNGLDPAPLRWRDLDRKVVSYLDDCSSDIPLKYPVNLEIICPKEILNEGRESRVMGGLRTFFNYMVLTYKKDLSIVFGKAAVYFITSFILIGLSFYLLPKSPGTIIFETLIEGLSIGGWVFLWESIVLAVFKSRKIRIRSGRYKRLAAAPVNFIYMTF